MSNGKTFFLIKLLSLTGVALASFLLWEQATKSPFRPCNINAFINCDAIISGPVAKTLGIPTPLYGLIGYIVIFVASLLRKKAIILGVATFGLGFCLWIAYKELFQLHVICPLCLLCQLTMISIFGLGLYLRKRRE